MITEAAFLIVNHGLAQLSFCVHYKRSSGSNGLVERLSTQDHQSSILSTKVLKNDIGKREEMYLDTIIQANTEVCVYLPLK